ncbi:hypothetical protein Q7P37_001656 [Cladosporium fusiforme]
MFKLQCLTYISLNADKLETNRKQLLFITSYLRGPAYEWILPHLEDFLEHPKFEDLKNTTKVIIAGKAAFFTELQSTFRYGNEQMEAERALQTIQTTKLLRHISIGKMQLDATQGKPGSKGQKKGQKKSKDKSQVECYSCGKKGHYKNESTQGKGTEPETPHAATLAATTQDWMLEEAPEGRGAYNKQSDMDTDDGHDLKSWTACYEDSCSIHYSDKIGLGYFLSRRRQSICLTRGMLDHAQTAQNALTQFPTEEIED